ncbi:hypothetical protein U3A58_10425 [Algoriphagus sp. C2-6-M1]|uniref:hypothetical protein n=1 Tax=Algoriphagus persicinus TaxID=3108754 RepID=UPI002B3940DD|nr:hypothetical protein [Algoriphagus sp. C2-6-M1]MEB2780809.1 hypothetical protein [Algoriphagus sp. C2-6-M1]
MIIDETALRVILSRMPDGFVFEHFAHKILSIVLGDEFIPVGGSGDQGIDGFQFIYQRKERSKLIYQISTEEVHWKQKSNKITETVTKLVRNTIGFDKLYFVTNRKVHRKDSVQENLYSEHEVDVIIYDQEWFVTQVLADPNATDVYLSFLETYVHEYNKPGKLIEVADFSGDSRLYAFLRHQVDEGGNEAIEENILDGLILYSLEETGSEKGVFKDVSEVITSINKITKFKVHDFEAKVESRLLKLSSNGAKKIKHHTKENYFCLPYETRIELAERDVKDLELQEAFKEESLGVIKNNLSIVETKVLNVYELFEEILHSIYYRQGLEFSDFVLYHNDKDIIDQSLQTIVFKVVDESRVVIENRGSVKKALLLSLREIAYNGTENQREYLRRMSKTYMMVFLTQNDPKISLFFKSLANKLEVYVGTSIIVPAFSELFLENENKRYWNLLLGARAAGVSLKVNEYIIDELVSHIRGINNTYLGLYKHCESDYLEDEITFLYIDEILLRSYFYARQRSRISDFNSFLMKFVDPSLSTLRSDIIQFLKDVFGIEYVTLSSQKVTLDNEEVQKLIDHLKATKKSEKRAEVDAKLILHLYKLREINNETDNAGIFGYKTWWLSQDINTFRSVKEVFPEKYDVSCYMRSDFMYKYISLSPKKEDIDLLYRKCFPNLLGVNLSYHIPQGVSEFVSQKITEHKDTEPTIVKRTLKNLTERLMSATEAVGAKQLKSYFEDELEKLSTGN